MTSRSRESKNMGPKARHGLGKTGIGVTRWNEAKHVRELGGTVWVGV